MPTPPSVRRILAHGMAAGAWRCERAGSRDGGAGMERGTAAEGEQGHGGAGRRGAGAAPAWSGGTAAEGGAEARRRERAGSRGTAAEGEQGHGGAGGEADEDEHVGDERRGRGQAGEGAEDGSRGVEARDREGVQLGAKERVVAAAATVGGEADEEEGVQRERERRVAVGPQPPREGDEVREKGQRRGAEEEAQDAVPTSPWPATVAGRSSCAGSV